MKSFFKFLLFGSLILIVVLATRFYEFQKRLDTTAISPPIEEKLREDKDTIFHLEGLNLKIELEKNWAHTSLEQGNIHGFTVECEDTVFCTSLSFTIMPDDRLSKLSDEILGDQLLKQLATTYHQCKFIGSYPGTTGDGIKVRCFDYSFYERESEFYSSTAIVEGPPNCFVTYITRKTKEVPYDARKNEFLEVLNGVKREY